MVRGSLAIITTRATGTVKVDVALTTAFHGMTTLAAWGELAVTDTRVSLEGPGVVVVRAA
ncbi:hypothetical protein [Acidipropionibacterium virtanenii]|nr:hypothetical protein [Acidipropionibacterium virtanenii]